MNSRQLFEYHPRLAYRFIPGLRARIAQEQGGYLVAVNSSGFRSDAEFVREKPQHVRRVLAFGDSYTAGEGVSNAHRFTDVLQKRLSSTEIYNFGLPGTGTDQQFLAYQEFARGIEHDLLMLVVLVENIRRITARYRVYFNERGESVIYSKPYFELVDGHLMLRNVPAAREPINEDDIAPGERATIDRGGRFPVLSRLVGATGLQHVAQKVGGYQPLPEFDSPDHPAWQLLAAILTEWVRQSRAPVLLVPLPLYHYVEEISDPLPYQNRFAELASELGCALFNPLPALQRYSIAERREFRFRTDPHLTIKGHLAIADALEAPLRDMLNGPTAHTS